MKDVSSLKPKIVWNFSVFLKFLDSLPCNNNLLLQELELVELRIWLKALDTTIKKFIARKGNIIMEYSPLIC